MIAALFALVVFQQAQIAHLNTRLITVLENQVAATALERNTAIRRQGAPGPPAHHFYREHDEIARSAPRAPTRNLRDGHYMGPFDITLPRKIAANVHPTAPLESLPWQQLALCLLGLITAAVWMPDAGFVRRIFKRQTQPDSAQPEFQSQNAAQKSRRKKKKRQPTSASESEWPKSPTDEPLKAELTWPHGGQSARGCRFQASPGPPAAQSGAPQALHPQPRPAGHQ